MKKYVLLIVLFIGITAFAQKDLNTYKYIVIPSKFDFQKEANEYGVNLLLKYKFQQLGFETYLDTDDLPEILRTNTCLYAYPVLHTSSNMFKTITSIEMFNCSNKSLFKTQQGISSSKNIKVSYNEAIRKSLKSFGDYRLEYTPVKEELVIKENNQLVNSKVVRLDDNEVISENRLNNGSFNYKEQEYKLIKKSFMFFEIQNKNTKDIVGKMIASDLKKGVYHIEFNSRIGFCYYGENENIIMEFMSSDNSVEMISLPRVD